MHGMHFKERIEGDRNQWRKLARAAKNTEQRDRLLAVHHELGGMETFDIAAAILRSRKFVQRWAYAYRDGGIDAIVAKPRGGRAPALGGEAAAKLTTRLDAGATERDKVCTLRGKDVQRIVTASNDKTARVWEAAIGQSLVELKDNHPPILGAEFSPDGTRIMIKSKHGTMRVWDSVPYRERLKELKARGLRK